MLFQDNATPLDAENLNKGNWRVDTSLSFKKQSSDNLPAAKSNETQIITKLNGETWLVPPLNSGVAKELGKAAESGTVTVTEADLLKKVYPVGAIYMSVVNTSPGSLFGGSWTSWGAGRVPLAIGDNGTTNYTTAESTGGSETSVAVHSHSNTAAVGATGNSTINLRGKRMTEGNAGPLLDAYISDSTSTRTNYRSEISYSGIVNRVSRSTTDDSYADQVNLTHNHSNPNFKVSIADAGTTGGNRMPYITCYMWKRIS